MENYIIGIDLATGKDITVTRNIIYSAYGLTREKVETKENSKQLAEFKRINNME